MSPPGARQGLEGKSLERISHLSERQGAAYSLVDDSCRSRANDHRARQASLCGHRDPITDAAKTTVGNGGGGYMVSAKGTAPSPRSTFFRSLPDAFLGSLSCCRSTNAGTLN